MANIRRHDGRSLRRGTRAQRAAAPDAGRVRAAGYLALAETARDWHTQPQLSYGDLPPTIHLTVTAAVGPTAGQFGPDLADAVAAARGRGPVELPSLPALTPDDVTPEIVAGLADSLGLAGRDFGRMAGVNTVLNACPPALREALLTGFLSLLQQAED